jgi:hypothetical protein
MVLTLAATVFADEQALHPDSSTWEDVFDKDLSKAVSSVGWIWDSQGWLTPTNSNSLFTKKDYGSYVLDCEYTLAAKGNSGIFIYDTKHPSHKIEVQLFDDYGVDVKKYHTPYQLNCALYGRAAPSVVNSKPAGEVNRMTITCDGGIVKIALNGKLVLDVNLDDWKDPLVNPDGSRVPKWHTKFPLLSTIPRHGCIGLQGLHGGAPVRFKYLKVKEIK